MSGGINDALIWIGSIVGVGSLYYAYMDYKKNHPLKEYRQIVIEKFEFLQRLNNELIENLSAYGTKYNCFDLPFSEGLTLSQCINILQDVKQKILTSENYKALKTSNSKLRLEGIMENLKIQIDNHSGIKTYHDRFLSQGVQS